jgi:voltage-gated potassium channel
VVVCGYGRMGEQVCQEFSKAGVPFVIVDRNAAVLEDLTLPHAHPLVGDATSDDVLRSAGLERARALVATAASDADNVFITMTARLLNDKVPIVARAEEDSTVPKLRRAGATRVVSPYVLGGGRVAQAVLRPAVLDFLEVTTRKEHMDLQIEEVAIAKASALDGQTIHESRLRSEVGLIVVAIKRRDGHMTFNPAEDVSLGAGDTLIMLGRPEQLLTVDRLASAR